MKIHYPYESRKIKINIQCTSLCRQLQRSNVFCSSGPGLHRDFYPLIYVPQHMSMLKLSEGGFYLNSPNTWPCSSSIQCSISSDLLSLWWTSAVLVWAVLVWAVGFQSRTTIYLIIDFPQGQFFHSDESEENWRLRELLPFSNNCPNNCCFSTHCCSGVHASLFEKCLQEFFSLDHDGEKECESVFFFFYIITNSKVLLTKYTWRNEGLLKDEQICQPTFLL